jgi:mono/diheme cytochrome c family protein
MPSEFKFMKKKLLFVPLTFFLAFFMVWSCKHDPVEMAGPTPPDPLCDTLDVTYTSDVYPIFEQYCIFCHSGTTPDAGIDLTNYDDVATIAQSGQLLGSINHDPGYAPMPKGAEMLDFCNIRTITIWVNDTTFTVPGNPCDPDTVYFEKDLLPVLQSSCAQPGCHDAITMQDGVRLTDYNSVMQTADVVPYDPNDSKIYEAITDDDPEDRMPPPPANPLAASDIDLVYTWIAQGAQNLYCDEEDCDTSNVTYTAPVSGIIQKHCLGCHNNNNPLGGLSLEGYNNVVAIAEDGRLLGVVKHQVGYPPMPKNSAQLSDCKIDQLEIWTQNGTPQ